MAATVAVMISPMTVRDDNIMSGPAHVIFPFAMRFWISTCELGDAAADVFKVAPPFDILLANGCELSGAADLLSRHPPPGAASAPASC
jgi:hypothetical protein